MSLSRGLMIDDLWLIEGLKRVRDDFDNWYEEKSEVRDVLRSFRRPLEVDERSLYFDSGLFCFIRL